MRMQWDAALVAATARALDRRFHRERVRAYLLDPEPRRFVLYLKGATLAWDLHPERLGLALLDPVEPPPEARRLPAQIRRVWAPADDRLMVVETRRVRGKPPQGSIILELFPNQENVVVTEGAHHTVRVLLRTREGERPVRRGQPYVFPPASGRAGARTPLTRTEWDTILADTLGGERRKQLLRNVAWVSPIVAEELLGDDGWPLYQRLRDAAVSSDGGGDVQREGGPHTEATPGGQAAAGPHAPLPPAAVISGRHGPQPYPVALPNRTRAETSSLLDAFALSAELSERDAGALTALIPGALLTRLDDAVDRARSRVARLEEELQGLDDPDERQGWGDLLLARFHEVPEGADEVVLEGFDGGAVRIPLERKLTPDANARRHYDRAARLRRAAEELPGRIEDARRRWSTLEELRDDAATGDATREEVEAALPAAAPGRQGSDAQAASLPYRLYRSTGGHEIRVGRGAARNDDLTFHHGRPDDIWLHARHAAGAHVILRWDGEGSPPPRDLEEAAILAALYSKARTSGSVPVDWTRRKHVRKPRKAPPGAVLPQQVRTVFVEPDEGLEERLKVE